MTRIRIFLGHLHSFWPRLVAGTALVAILSACAGGLPGLVFSTPAPTRYPFPSPTPSARLPVTFVARVPQELESGASVMVNLLDEVTGLALNASSVAMQLAPDGSWQARVDLPRGRLVYYRYSLRAATESLEGLPDGEAVDYRLYFVTGAGTVADQISRWLTTPFQGATGQVHGLVRDNATGQAAPGLLVTLAGMRTYTDSSGFYSFDGVPVGKHMILVFDPDGNYRPFEQEALVADGAETPADISLDPSARVSVTFHVFLPEDTPRNVPVRMVGNLLSLGDALQPGPAGELVDPERAPTLTPLPDGTSVVVLSLPIGFHLRYKYTLGDGFWNAERDGQGALGVRELDVPQADLLATDGVISWHSLNGGPVSFDVTVPAGTPGTETVAIQFSPFPGVWMNPIPMWLVAPQRWGYTLFGPLEWPGNVAYRYCRNADCGVADDVATAGPAPAGRQFVPAVLPQSMKDTVQAWVAWSDAPHAPITLPALSSRPDFRSGVVMAASPWPRPFDPTLVDLVNLRLNSVFLSPAWFLGRAAPQPEIAFLPARGSPLRQDLLAQIGSARSAGLRVGLAPDLLPQSGSLGDWWAAAPKSLDWWNVFFTAYRSFIISYADLAQQSGVEELLVARASMAPAMPGEVGAAPDAEVRWRALLRDIRTHFAGRIGVELLATDHLQPPPAFLDAVDDIFVQVRAPLASSDTAGADQLNAAAASVLDGKIAVLRAVGKPVIIEAAYASASGGAGGCPLDASGRCLALESLAAGSALALGTAPNLGVQLSAYQALLGAAATRDWIKGFMSWGYYAPVGLRDASPSVHGKSAEAVLQAYYQALSGR